MPAWDSVARARGNADGRERVRKKTRLAVHAAAMAEASADAGVGVHARALPGGSAQDHDAVGRLQERHRAQRRPATGAAGDAGRTAAAPAGARLVPQRGRGRLHRVLQEVGGGQRRQEPGRPGGGHVKSSCLPSFGGASASLISIPVGHPTIILMRQ